MRMNKVKYIWLALLVTGLLAQDTKYGGAFLELGIGARPLSMGSAYVAVARGGSGFYWNPGGPAYAVYPEVSAMYASLFNSLENHGYASVVFPILGNAVLTGAWIRLAVDDIPRFYDSDLLTPRGARLDDPAGSGLTDPASGSFTFSNNAYVISFAKLSRLSADLGWQYFEMPVDIGYGVNFKMLDIGLDNKSGTGIGVDAGIKILIGLDEVVNEKIYGNFAFGITVRDLFETSIAWDTNSKQTDKIERSWRYGFAYLQNLNFLNSRVVFAYDIESRYNGSKHFGFEYQYKSLFAIRLGSNNGELTAGAGISYWKLRLDYAYQNHDLGNSHRVSTSFILD